MTPFRGDDFGELRPEEAEWLRRQGATGTQDRASVGGDGRAESFLNSWFERATEIPLWTDDHPLHRFIQDVKRLTLWMPIAGINLMLLGLSVVLGIFNFVASLGRGISSIVHLVSRSASWSELDEMDRVLVGVTPFILLLLLWSWGAAGRTETSPKPKEEQKVNTSATSVAPASAADPIITPDNQAGRDRQEFATVSITVSDVFAVRGPRLTVDEARSFLVQNELELRGRMLTARMRAIEETLSRIVQEPPEGPDPHRPDPVQQDGEVYEDLE